MAFEDNFWLANSTFAFDTSGPPGVYDPAPVGLTSFVFGGGSGVNSTSRVRLNPFQCTASLGDCLNPNQVGELVVFGHYNFQLTLGSVLTGFIEANDTNSNVRMASSGPVWTVETYRTDGPGPYACISGHYCGGGTGLWVLDRSTVPVATPVPEPETYAMWLAGMFIAGVALRRRSG
jgi:hypothetical protein